METINIPEEVSSKIKAKIGEKPIHEYILQLIHTDLNSGSGFAYSDADEEKVKERLKSLGYLD